MGSEIFIISIPLLTLKAANNARAVKAAEPIAKPLPIAAVVLPTASSLSVPVSYTHLTLPTILLV